MPARSSPGLGLAAETRLLPATFPEDCPFALADVLDADYWPDPAA